MIVSYEINSAPVVYLSANTAEESTQDALVVEGQEELELEAQEESVETAIDSEESVETNSVEEGSSEEVSSEETASEEVASEQAVAEKTDEDTLEGEMEESAEDIGGEAEVSSEEAEGEVVEGEMDGMAPEGDMTEGVTEVKDPLLSSPVAVGGISLAVIVAGCVIGFILAKRRIKKGIEVYEDF